MDEALKLAKRGNGWTYPNPMVGAVIVNRGQIIAKGYHKRVGLPHAEVEALKRAKKSLKGATLYVNLEPCTHYGKTPPCVDAIIQSGIKHVVCSILDPNPKVHGRGIAKLKQAGIAVSVGLRKKESRSLNEAFFTFHEKKRPFVAIKFAASLDGKIATKTGDSQWISNKVARNYARSLRSQYQAILVGINTVIQDNPHLGVRQKNKKDPLRIILDSTLKIPLTTQVLRDTNVLIASTTKANKEKMQVLTKMGIPVILFNSASIPLSDLLEELKKRKIISVLVEGGSQVLGSFIDAKLVDKVYAFHAPLIIGGQGITTIAQAPRLTRLTTRTFATDHLTIGYPQFRL